MSTGECQQVVKPGTVIGDLVAVGAGGGRCGLPTAYLFTWPGKNESEACEYHARQIQGVADAMGMHLQLTPVVREQPAR